MHWPYIDLNALSNLQKHHYFVTFVLWIGTSWLPYFYYFCCLYVMLLHLVLHYCFFFFYQCVLMILTLFELIWFFLAHVTQICFFMTLRTAQIFHLGHLYMWPELRYRSNLLRATSIWTVISEFIQLLRHSQSTFATILSWHMTSLLLFCCACGSVQDCDQFALDLKNNVNSQMKIGSEQ